MGMKQISKEIKQNRILDRKAVEIFLTSINETGSF